MFAGLEFFVSCDLEIETCLRVCPKADRFARVSSEDGDGGRLLQRGQGPDQGERPPLGAHAARDSAHQTRGTPYFILCVFRIFTVEPCEEFKGL